MNLRRIFGNYPTDEQIDQMLRTQFLELTGVEAVEVSQVFPFDRNFTILTMNETYRGKLTFSARKIQKGTLELDNN